MNIISIVSIVEIIVLILVFIWIYILYKKEKRHSLRIARIILIILSIIIVITHILLSNKNIKVSSDYLIEKETKIEDNVAPKISLNGDENLVLNSISEYKEYGVTAIDDVDGDLTNKVEIKREKLSNTQYQVKYSVTDSAGNDSETVIRKISIKDNNPNKKGVIYLTFDDGPSSDITPKILDVLKRENVKATFFTINFSEENEAIVKREVNEGHTIGIHGYSHEYSQIYSSDEAYMNNILKLQEKIKNVTGVTTKYTRFPGGSSNTISKKYSKGIMTRMTQKLLADGFYYYDWNVSGEDAASAKTKEEVYNNVINELSKSRANIVLLHDFGKSEKTLEALPDIINYGKQNGYTFENITEQTPMITHGVNN